MLTEVLSDVGNWSSVDPQQTLSVDSDVNDKNDERNERSQRQGRSKQLDTQTQTDRHRYRQLETDRETDRHTHTDRQTDSYTHM